MIGNYKHGGRQADGRAAFAQTAAVDKVGALLALFDVLTDSQQDRALHLLGWERIPGPPPAPVPPPPGSAGVAAASRVNPACGVHGPIPCEAAGCICTSGVNPSHGGKRG